MDLLKLAEEDRFRYYERHEMPALFVLQVAEGLVKLPVRDLEDLNKLLAYSRKKGLRVEWSKAVLDRPEFTEELEGYPGGRYVAHSLPEDMLDVRQGGAVETEVLHS